MDNFDKRIKDQYERESSFSFEEDDWKSFEQFEANAHRTSRLSLWKKFGIGLISVLLITILVYLYAPSQLLSNASSQPISSIEQESSSKNIEPTNNDIEVALYENDHNKETKPDILSTETIQFDSKLIGTEETSFGKEIKVAKPIIRDNLKQSFNSDVLSNETLKNLQDEAEFKAKVISAENDKVRTRKVDLSSSSSSSSSLENGDLIVYSDNTNPESNIKIPTTSDQSTKTDFISSHTEEPGNILLNDSGFNSNNPTSPLDLISAISDIKSLSNAMPIKVNDSIANKPRIKRNWHMILMASSAMALPLSEIELEEIPIRNSISIGLQNNARLRYLIGGQLQEISYSAIMLGESVGIEDREKPNQFVELERASAETKSLYVWAGLQYVLINRKYINWYIGSSYGLQRIISKELEYEYEGEKEEDDIEIKLTLDDKKIRWHIPQLTTGLEFQYRRFGLFSEISYLHDFTPADQVLPYLLNGSIGLKYTW